MAQSNALHFDGNDDYVQIPDVASGYSFMNGFSFSAWIKWESLQDDARIFEFGNGEWVGNNTISLRTGNSGSLNLHSSFQGLDSQINTQDNIVKTQQWYHVVATISNSGLAKIYIDGNLVKSGNVYLPQGTSRQNNWLGKSCKSSDPYFHGCMDEISIWERELPASDIDRISVKITSPSSVQGLLAYYNCDQGTASSDNNSVSILSDNTSNNFIGSLNNFSLKGNTSNWIESFKMPNITFKSTKNSFLTIYVKMNKEGILYIDYGDGNIDSMEVTQNKLITLTTSNVANKTVKLYNPNISEFYVTKQEIVAINTQNSEELTYLDCNGNNLTFATLPSVKFNQPYSYDLQNKVSISCINGVVDLSSQLTATDMFNKQQTTNYKWFTSDNSELTAGVDYIESKGIFKFIKIPATQVYCMMTNNAFPSLTLKTNNITIDSAAKPNITLEASTEFLYMLYKTSLPGTITVDFGNGELISYTTNGAIQSISNYVRGKQVSIYGDDINQIDVSNMKVNKLDVSGATNLMQLFCMNNQLTYLDLSKNHSLNYLECRNNNIEKIDMPEIDLTYNINCTNNKLTFATLPKNKEGIIYLYSSQKKMAVTCTQGVVDLSSQQWALNHFGYQLETVYKCFKEDDTEMVLGKDYFLWEGKLNFLSVPEGKVYCQMTNMAFPDLTLKTENFTVDAIAQRPAPDVTFISSSNGSLDLYLDRDNYDIAYIDFGDGTMQPIEKMEETSINVSTSSYTADNTVKIYMPGITSFSASDCKIKSIDVSRATDLTNLGLSNNELSELNISNNIKLEYLTLHSNKLTDIDLTKNTLLSSLAMEANNIKTLDLSKNKELQYLECPNNQLTSLDLSNNPKVYYLYCANNKLSFATLPQLTLDEYIYYPQQEIYAECINGTVDLSSQLNAKDIDNNLQITNYAWTLADNTTLVAGEDYTENNGVFIFTKTPSSKAVCTMTNSAFPELTLKTVEITITKIATGFDKNETTKVQIFPNPSTDYVSISAGQLVSKVTFTNLAGQQVMSVDAPSERIGINALIPGVYIVTIEFAHGEKTTLRVVKK